MTLVAGVDIGGTSVKLGVVDATGRVVARAQQQIHPSEQAPAQVVTLACSLLQQALEEVDERLLLMRYLRFFYAEQQVCLYVLCIA